MAPAPTANEQMVEWAGAVGSGETVTVTITAVFTGQETFEETAELFVYTARVYWPVIFKQ
jgi:hypothetical protein